MSSVASQKVMMHFSLNEAKVDLCIITHDTGFHFTTITIDGRLVAFSFRIRNGEKESRCVEEGEWYTAVQQWLAGELTWDGLCIAH